MDPVTILAIVNGVANLVKTVAPVALEAHKVMTTDDQATLEKSLADIDAALAIIRPRVLAKLDAASKL